MWAFPHTTNWQNIFFVAALHVAASCISLENARTTSLAHYQPVLAARVQSPPVKGLKYFFMWLWQKKYASACFFSMMFAFGKCCHFVNDVVHSTMMSLRECFRQTSHHCEWNEQHHYAKHNIILPQAMHHLCEGSNPYTKLPETSFS